MPKLLFFYLIYIVNITPTMYDNNQELLHRLFGILLVITVNTTAGAFEIKNLHVKLFNQIVLNLIRYFANYVRLSDDTHKINMTMFKMTMTMTK